MKKILLTGATGLIGRFVVDLLLKKGYAVHAVSNRNSLDISNANLTNYKINLLDKDKTEKLIKEVEPSYLLHFAWYVEHGKFWKAPENLDWTAATLHLAKCFEKSGGRRMVFAGTCYEYDLNNKTLLSEKTAKLSPNTLYGTSKLSSNLILEKFSELSNLSYACGRPFFIFGPHENENRLVASVILSLLKDKPAPTSHGNQIRDFMFIGDLAEGFISLLESNVCGSVNIASGEGIKLKEIIEMIADIIGKPELLRIGEIPASDEEPQAIIADVTRLRNEVGFKKEYNLRKKLTETIDWWKKEYENKH